MNTLEAMRAFVRLVDLGTFSAVAADLQVKQSTVSKWIGSLEQELQTQLVERTTRSKRITESGHQLYEKARALLDQYEAVLGMFQQQGQEQLLQGRLRISVPTVFGRMYVLAHVMQFIEQYPGISLELEYNDRYVNVVEEGYDVAIRVGILTDSTLRSRRLGGTHRVLVASPDYLAQKGTPATPKELEDHECLLHSGVKTEQVWKLEKGGHTHRAHTKGRHRSNNSEALLEMAVRGMGIALLADWLVAKEVNEGRLVQLLENYQLPQAPIHALMPPGTFVHPRVRRFLDHMKEAFQSISLDTTLR